MPPLLTDAYKVGDTDQRPWGSYIVTAVELNAEGEEFCTKDITVLPGKVLSLQSHELRHERWTVKSGTLTVVLDDHLLTLQKGESIDIPIQSIHCMANLTATPCIVREIQEGTCRETDIKRYIDANGRQTAPLISLIAEASIAHYSWIVTEISKMRLGAT